MYLTKQNIAALNDIITGLNQLDEENARKEFLERHTEDAASLLAALNRLNKSKLPKQHRKKEQSITQPDRVRLYSDTQLEHIFSENDDDNILQNYSVAELRSMYYSAYQRNASTHYTKLDLVRTLRRRFFAVKRGEAFARLADERTKKGCNS